MYSSYRLMFDPTLHHLSLSVTKFITCLYGQSRFKCPRKKPTEVSLTWGSFLGLDLTFRTESFFMSPRSTLRGFDYYNHIPTVGSVVNSEKLVVKTRSVAIVSPFTPFLLEKNESDRRTKLLRVKEDKENCTSNLILKI